MDRPGVNPDVAEVVTQLQQAIRQRRAEKGGPPAGTPGHGVVSIRAGLLDQVHATEQVNPHLPIAWPTWPGGFWPKIVAAAQKVTRRLLRWYINPIVAQQNAHNAAVDRLLVRLCEIAEEQERQLADLRLQVQARQPDTGNPEGRGAIGEGGADR